MTKAVLLCLSIWGAVPPLVGAQAMDSLVVTLPVAREAAIDRLLLSWVAAGVPVTDVTPWLVTGDLSRDGAGIVMRAVLVARGDRETMVLLTTELVTRTGGRRRMTVQQGGEVGRAWDQMVSIAQALDPAQVPATARRR